MKRFIKSGTHPNRTQSAMQTHLASRRRRTALTAALAVAPAALGLTACHDLSEQPPSAITPATFFQTDAQIQAGLAGVYSSLRSTQGSYHAVSQASSDETIVPTRGKDWLDGGQWVELWQHTYGPSSGAGNQNINNAYNDLSSGIAKANATIQSLQASNSAGAKAAIDESRVLRAWYYFELQDLFGGVPIVTAPSLQAQPRATRDSVARFIESELIAARPSIQASDASNLGRVIQGTVDAMLASLYLNWPVFTGTPTATGITLGTQQRYQDVITVTDRIINSGVYSMASDSASWVKVFSPGNQGNKEIIFAVRNKAAQNPNLGLDLVARAVHYNSYSSSGGYNGYSTIVDTYNQFDQADARRSVFLVGPQRTLDTGQPVVDAGAQVNFTPTITSINAAAVPEGIRWYKFKFDPGHVGDQMGVDFTIFRLRGVYLDRAEAYWRLGQTGQALAILNMLRSGLYNPPQPITGALSANVFLRERLNELSYEAKRRQDMIRLGTFTAPKRFKPNADAGYQVVFPIPTTQIQANPLLTQNPGYSQ